MPPARDCLTAALQYAARGWAVLPIRPGAKVPLTQHGVKDATTSEITIRRWWQQWPTAGVGIACGEASGIIVLDVDPRSGGEESARTLDRPSTLTAMTGGGGYHYIYASPGGPRRGRNGWLPGVDIKADGGYIVAAPSQHESGARYAWAADDIPVAPAPQWLLDATAPPARPMVVPSPVVRSDAQVRRVRAYVARMPESVQGHNGSGALMRVCGRLVAEERAGRLQPEDVVDLVEEYNARCAPPWSRRELDHAIDSARRDPRQTPLEDRERTPTPMSAPKETAEDDWTLLLIPGRKPGEWLRCAENVETVLRHDPRWKGRISLDVFASNIRISDPPWREHQRPEEQGEFWTDTDDTRLASWVLREFGLDVSTQDCFRAVAAVAESRRVHPVRDWMDSLQWDGERRLDSWLQVYLGAEVSDYVSAVGRWWLISAVSRTYEPGCKADHVLILEGRQGIGKSSALRALAGSQWFSDTPLDLSNKDAFLAIQGRLVVELSELDSLRRSEVERVKAFFSSPADTFRAPYMRRSATVPRSCVFAGTTNASQYLVDNTGARRFWPVACAEADLDGLKKDRTQLWAEAVAAYGKGEKWWPDSEGAIEMVTGQQAERQVVDEWQTLVARWLEGRTTTDVSEILREALRIEPGKWGRAEQIRIGTIMKSLPEWNKKRQREGQILRWVYERR